MMAPKSGGLTDLASASEEFLKSSPSEVSDPPRDNTALDLRGWLNAAALQIRRHV
jgi:hypothetical protein